MTSILVKVKPTEPDNWGFDRLMALRQWCYKNVKSPWGSYTLGRPDEITTRSVIFVFENENEALKFKLYSG